MRPDAHRLRLAAICEGPLRYVRGLSYEERMVARGKLSAAEKRLAAEPCSIEHFPQGYPDQEEK